MHKDRRLASWLSRWTRPRPQSLRDDPADYGTAFGLEMCVDPAADAGAPASPSRAIAVPAPAAGHWWSRWRQRAT